MFGGAPASGRIKGEMFTCNVLLGVLLLGLGARAEILTPPYFNLAEGRKITATATCGDEEPELYCKLVGANAENGENINVIQGQVCDFCDLNSPTKRHPPEFAADGMETWWQSPPLSRGMKYNEVNLTIDLGQEFHVAYVFVQMGNSPRPGLWALEKSSDYGKTYKPWQYFSDSLADCETHFGKESLLPITNDDSVICNTEYSKIVPLEGGEIPISLLNNRPSANKYFNSPLLQEWTRATNVRLRLLRTKTLLGHLMSVARQDPTVTRRYFYSIKDVSIGGRCMCNGHAESCDIPDLKNPNKLLCRCQHHTCGPQCAYCCPGFEQKAWRQSQRSQLFVCEPCNCFDHSNECKYDADIDDKRLSLDIHGMYKGGGVCQNCQHNTEGINCNKCKSKFYRPRGKHWNQTDVCEPCNCQYSNSTGNCEEETGRCECRKEFLEPWCDQCSYGYYDFPNCKLCPCNLNGTEGNYCEPIQGTCPCKNNYAGIHCEQCSNGFFNFPSCEECACNPIGSLITACDQVSGNCTCKNNFRGRTCDRCEAGFYNYPDCKYCNCDSSGTLADVCDSEFGTCLCKEGFGGPRCDQCIPGYYNELRLREQVCVECKCSIVGSRTTSCDAGTGKCTCLYNFAGKQCDQCSPGYYKYPECLPCSCDSMGAIGVTCDIDGQCQCKKNFDTARCNMCKDGFYNFPACEECNCDPAGVVQLFAGCASVPEGELCKCKERVQGRICDDCRPLFWDLQQNNPLGCVDCDCFVPGTQGGIGVCDTKSGLCACKYSVGERSCRQCKDGSYNLTEANLFGCIDCGCDVGGSVNNICDKESGQCTCKPRLDGLRCDEPLQTHYFPTLHQYQYEVEDALNPSGNPVQYDYSESNFPGFSWKGYAVFSNIRNEINQDIYILKSSLYRMVLRYVNPNRDPIIGKVTITPAVENLNEIEQKFDVLLKPTTSPQFVTVSGPQGTIPSPMVMNPGYWMVTIKIGKTLYLDYFALVPAAYYEATILTRKVDSVCSVGDKELCRHFGYPNISSFDYVRGAGGFTSRNGVRDPIYQYIDYRQQLKELKETEIPLVDKMQDELLLDLTVAKAGPHVMLIEYVTPVEKKYQSGGTITITARGSASQEYSKVHLNSCPYTFACRQVLTDESSRVQIFNIQDNNVGLTLKGDNNTSVGIKSIVVIPYNQWHLDFIKPQSICVRKNGMCVQAEFPPAPDSKKVEFESGPETVAKIRPANIYDNSTDLIYLNADNSHVDITSKVPFPGQYVFIVQYYQPDYPEFDLDVLIQNGQMYEATLPIKHCPSNAGCRSVIKMPEGTNRFSLTENFLLTVSLGKEPITKAVWFDYLMVVPAEYYADSSLTENQLDQTREFISTCGTNHFFVDVSDDGFCRAAVFSLTSDYNNGALPCGCDYRGSLSFECEPFGGQCQCRDNVIGRMCDACKRGYYGFPECKPCGCPSTAHCKVDTGECICPKRVTGEKCDQCKPYTYGFNPIIGCEDCSCEPLGVINDQLQCDLLTGECRCKPNIHGRTCNHCVPGHYDFPYCVRCDCDTNGTLADICDEETAACNCKSNVYGRSCEACKDGHFDLQNDNDGGCTKCFCFGKTTRCSSANLYWSEVSSMNNWYLVNIAVTHNISVTSYTVPPQKLSDSVIGVDFNIDEYVNKTVYFGAPQEFLGNKLSSYGGMLQYSILYTAGLFGNAVSQGDVILKGADIWLIHSSIEQPPASITWRNQLELRETQFITVSGHPATRELLMTVLENLQSVYIRATYWQSSATTRLQEVSLQVGVKDWMDGSEEATSVEDCQCPANYQGYSCEECAKGFYRVNTGPHGGFCVPCQCNNHATSCDVNTGVCLDCQHNTQGDHCDECIEGYHGNALSGTPKDCLICACPLPITSNNFATSCEVSSDGEQITCECKEGYFGARCESCDSGFYGNPQMTGEFCSPCDCSGNINPDDRGSCDTITGDCLKCMNNTYGAACHLCEPGFYGDAIILKDCQVCLCDTTGMEKCDSMTGVCICRPGVIGDKCDRCQDEHWGIESGEGCKACNCSVASQSKQCDDNTGQCKCMPGVTRKNCDMCASGFWNYSPTGCVTCECNTGYSIGLGCNAATGHCECLPGVIGDKCDHCPYRNVLIPDRGCYECDSCTHDLLDSTDNLQQLIDPVKADFENKASGYFTAQRLVYITNQLDIIKPSVLALDPNEFDLSKTSNKIDDLETDGKNLNRKAEYAASDAEKLKVNAGELLSQYNTVLNDVIQSTVKSKATVAHVWDLATSLETSEWPRIDKALAEAKQIYSDLEAKDLSLQTNNSKAQLESADKLVEEMLKFLEPVSNQMKAFNKLRDYVIVFDKNLDDIVNYTRAVEKKVEKVEPWTEKNRAAQINNKLDIVNNVKKESEKDLKLASEYLVNATYALNDAENSVDAAGQELNEGFRINNIVNTTILNLKDEAPKLDTLFDQAKGHVEVLLEKSQRLNDLYETSKNNSQTEHAVQGASAYPDIVKEINAANESAHAADAAMKNATILSKGLGERVAISKANSTNLHQEAFNSLQQVQAKLKPELNIAEKAVKTVQDLNQLADDSNNAIISSLSSVPVMSLEPFIEDANSNSQKVNETADEVNNIMKQVSQSLPNSLQQAERLPKDIDETMKSSGLIKNDLNTVEKAIPTIKKMVSDAQENHQKIDKSIKEVDSKIEQLRNTIAMAKDVANRIKVGVQFGPTTTLQLKPPDNVDELGTSTHVSAYFRTPQENGFLMYLGNQKGTKLRRTKSDDFMALEIVKGKPTLTINIGEGPMKITSDKTVSDNVWYQVIVDRVGKNVKMTIREELPGGAEKLHVTEDVLPGMHTIFNLDKDQSKLFVGGYPNAFNVQEDVEFSSFEGQIEELVIGDTPVGLWNFVDAQGNKNGAQGRGVLINQQPNTGYRFDGNGYAIVDSRSYKMQETSDIQLKFKTYAKEGLLFLAGKNRKFLSIEMRDGRVFLQYNLGGNVLTIGSLKTYNDGLWHTLSASRDRKKGQLNIDDVLIETNEASGSEFMLQISDKMYFGGYPNKHNYTEVINTGFDGCIDDVIISGTPVDLSQNLQAFGVNPGCPIKFARLVSFAPDSQGYLRKPNASSSNAFQLSLKFKTSAKEGLIFYATNSYQSAGISLSLLNGTLVALSQMEKLTTGSNMYNDDQWHVVTVTHDSSALGIVVDDYDDYWSDTSPPKLHFMYGDLFIGGVPPGYTITPSGSATKKSFSGCLGDATINGAIINFASAIERSGETLGRCTKEPKAISGQVPPTHVPMVPHEGNILEAEIDDITKPPPGRKNITRVPPHRIQGPNAGKEFKPKEPTTQKPISRKENVDTNQERQTKRPPPSVEKCKYGSGTVKDGNLIDGFRFGSSYDSRIEFEKLPARYKESFDFSIEFNTTSERGVLFYAADRSHKNFVSLFMKDGKIHYSFNCGTGPARLVSQKTYNDAEWHSVVFNREQTSGKLIVDGEVVAEGQSQGSSNYIIMQGPFYMGGIANVSTDVLYNLQESYNPFNGCLRNFLMGGEPVTDIKSKVATYSCAQQLERGIHFGGKGYLRLLQNIILGEEFEISLDIKTRQSSGILLSVNSRKGFIVLEIVNNTIIIRVNNGEGPFQASNVLKNQYLLCDGDWHNIYVAKSKHVVTVGVEGAFSEPGIGKGISTNITSSIFIGGHPYIGKVRGSRSHKNFIGCIKNIHIRKAKIEIIPSSAHGDARIGYCPAD